MLFLSLLQLERTVIVVQYVLKSLNTLKLESLPTQNQNFDFELVNFDDGCTKGGSKVQPGDATSHGLTAYKGFPYKHNFKMELRPHLKKCSCTIFCCAVQRYITVCCHQIHKIKTKD